MIDLLTAVRDQLIEDEGIRLFPYRDSLGAFTIGVGRNLVGKGITETEALYLCDNDIHESIADLQTFPWFAALNGARTAAVINLRFNLGPERFRTFRKFIDAMACGDHNAAADQLVESRWYSQVQRSRSTRIVRQIRDGV